MCSFYWPAWGIPYYSPCPISYMSEIYNELHFHTASDTSDALSGLFGLAFALFGIHQACKWLGKHLLNQPSHGSPEQTTQSPKFHCCTTLESRVW